MTALWAQKHPDLPAGGDGLLCIRPHDVGIRPAGEPANTLTAVVRSVAWQGDLHSVGLEVEGVALRLVCTPLREPPQLGEPLTVHFSAEDATLIPGDSPAAS